MASTTSQPINILHLLATSNSMTALDAAQNLLRTKRKNVNEREDDEGLTALHVAAAWDNLAMCQLLMFFGADPFLQDRYGRTAKDMAKGSVKKFFARLYETETPEIGRSVRQSFLRALRRLFSCASPSRAIKTTEPKRARSWSPHYDGQKNFLSEEEKRLRWAFRKNQPCSPGRSKAKKTEAKLEPSISPIGKQRVDKAIPVAIRPLPPSTSLSPPSDPAALPRNPESDDNATYTTARECNNSDSLAAKCPGRLNSSDAASGIVTRGIASLKIGPTPLWPKDWMTEESTSDESTNMKIPTEILTLVHQMSNKELKQELAKRGEYIGPLVESTRLAYELKLARLVANIPSDARKSKYSWALERWIGGHLFPEGSELDQIVISSFAGLSGEPCREGNRPTSFCYILIDPSLISHPSSSCTMGQFVDSIFYIGKGKRSRPFQHLIDAVRAKDFGDGVVSKSKKLQRIVNLWAAGHGVVSLHVFQNTIPVESFTREAAMIDAIGIENLTNIKRGDYYGPAKNWTTKEKTIYGSYLLFNALAIFHVEGCREIYEKDIQEK